MWDWALLELDVQIENDKQLDRNNALTFFIEQCKLLEELAKREAHYYRKGWPRAS
jgi:hypothetical protein